MQEKNINYSENKEKNLSDYLLDKLKILLNISDDKVLAEKIGVHIKTLNSWRQYDKADVTMIKKLFPQFRIELTITDGINNKILQINCDLLYFVKFRIFVCHLQLICFLYDKTLL